MSASNQAVPSGGYNAVGFDYLAPKTAATAILICTSSSFATSYFTFDGPNTRIKVDKITEHTGGNGVTFQKSIYFNETQFTIAADTANASDTKGVQICGGGAAAAGRGAFLQLYGADHASQAGRAFLGGDQAIANIFTFGAFAVRFSPNSTDAFEFDSGGNGVFYPASFQIKTNTTDGNDTRSITIGAGGAIANGRGARIELYGADHGSSPGIVAIVGDGGRIELATVSSLIRFAPNGATRWEISTAGDLTGDASNGGSLVFQRSGKGVVNKIALVASAGTTQGTATALTAVENYITSGITGAGVKLPPAVAGMAVTVVCCNSSNGALLYPDTGATINNFGANNYFEFPGPAIAADCIYYCYAQSTTQWRVIRFTGLLS